MDLLTVVFRTGRVRSGAGCCLLLRSSESVFPMMFGCDICDFNLNEAGLNAPNILSCGIDFCCGRAGLEVVSLGTSVSVLLSSGVAFGDGPALSKGSTNPPGTGTGNAVGGACLM
jgi:hypothetical protein